MTNRKFCLNILLIDTSVPMSLALPVLWEGKLCKTIIITFSVNHTLSILCNLPPVLSESAFPSRPDRRHRGASVGAVTIPCRRGQCAAAGVRPLPPATAQAHKNSRPPRPLADLPPPLCAGISCQPRFFYCHDSAAAAAAADCRVGPVRAPPRARGGVGRREGRAGGRTGAGEAREAAAPRRRGALPKAEQLKVQHSRRRRAARAHVSGRDRQGRQRGRPRHRPGGEDRRLTTPDRQSDMNYSPAPAVLRHLYPTAPRAGG